MLEKKVTECRCLIYKMLRKTEAEASECYEIQK